MKPIDKLTSDIRIHLDRQEATGWWSIHCPICNEKRTRTGGFFFGDDEIIYNCFRGKCDASCSLKVGEYVTKKFKNLMSTMGVKIPVEIVTAKKKTSLQQLLEEDDSLYKKHSYKEIALPEGCVPYDDSTYKSKEVLAQFYLNRACDLQDVFIFDDGKYKGLSAFGMYHHDKLIGMHIVSLSGKYISYYGGNDHVLYVPERKLSTPVILVEGGIDAKCFPNTAATLSSKITPEQAYLLKGREVIMIPDRKGGNKFINQFHDYGWSLCVPDWEEKDLNAAVLKYGKLVVAEKIIAGATKDLLDAKIRYKMWCMD